MGNGICLGEGTIYLLGRVILSGGQVAVTS